MGMDRRRRPVDGIACTLSRARHSFKPAWLVHMLSRSRRDDVEEEQGGQGQWVTGFIQREWQRNETTSLAPLRGPDFSQSENSRGRRAATIRTGATATNIFPVAFCSNISKNSHMLIYLTGVPAERSRFSRPIEAPLLPCKESQSVAEPLPPREFVMAPALDTNVTKTASSERSIGGESGSGFC